MFKQLSKMLGSQPSPDEYSWSAIDTMAEEMSPREGVWWATSCAEEVASELPADDLAALKATEEWVKNPCEETIKAVEEAAKQTDMQGPGAWAALAAMSAPAASAAVGAAGGAGAVAAAAAPAAIGATSMTAKAVAGAVKLSAMIASGDTPPPAPKQPELPEDEAPKLDEVPVRDKYEDMAESTPVRDEAEEHDDERDEAEERTSASADPEPHKSTAGERKETARKLKPFIDKGKDIQQGTNTWA